MITALVIPGEPMGKQRPRVTKYGTYTPVKTVNYETLVQQLWIMKKLHKLDGYIKADIKAYFSIPASASKKKKQEMICGKIRPTKKPDIDNIAKIVLDSLNKLAYDDDKQIISCNIEKWYGEEPRVQVTFSEIKGV